MDHDYWISYYKLKKIAVYGSLKKGKYNHSILESSKFLGKTQVTGTLYTLGAYPALCGSGNNKYEAEVYEVSDEVFDLIDRMELGAGYKRVERVFGNDIAIVYYADKHLEQHCVDNLKEISSY